MFGNEEREAAIWEQLLRLAENGDLRAIKLYYEMLEKQQRHKNAEHAEDDREIEQMAAIRRAVFGDMEKSDETGGDEDDSKLL